jgi:hypothetical protein
VQGATTGLNVDMNNRQLHPSELKVVKAIAKPFAQKLLADQGITREPTSAEITQAETRLLDQADRNVNSQSDLRMDNVASGYLEGVRNGLDRRGLVGLPGGGQYFLASPDQYFDTTMYKDTLKTPEGQAAYNRIHQSNVGDPAPNYYYAGDIKRINQENAQVNAAAAELVGNTAATVVTGGLYGVGHGIKGFNEGLDHLGNANTRQEGEQAIAEIAGSALEVITGGLIARSVVKPALAASARITAQTEAEAAAAARAKVENNANADGGVDPHTPKDPNAPAQQNIRDKAATDAANGTNNPHYDDKHGVGTTLQQQYDRAINGTNPQTGGTGRPADASKFFNATDMQAAIKQAEAEYAANPGKYGDGNVPVKFNRPIGEGYVGNTQANQRNNAPVGEYRWSNTATVGIDPATGKAYTAYPNVGLGVAKPDPLKNGVKR